MASSRAGDSAMAGPGIRLWLVVGLGIRLWLVIGLGIVLW